MEERGTPLVEMRNIHKWFGKVHAVNGVNFKIWPGEVVGLVGDNGAGKSTLIKILTGYHRADEGEIFFEGKKVRINSPRDARKLKIETVYQERALVDLIDIMRNVFLGREPTNRLGFLNKKLMKEKSLSILKDMGLSIKDPDVEVRFLSGGEKQGVAIARAIHFKAKLVILDEPTIALSVKEVKKVLDFVRKIKKQGVAVIFITHNLYHVYPIADRFYVMARGKIVKEFKKGETTIEELAEAIAAA
ncbi:MAG: ATP-binding cassette domain-containing protein [Candidatus Baldrarchaeia archaeon]